VSDEELSVWDHVEELAKRLRKILFLLIFSTVLISSIPSDLIKLIRLDFSQYKPLISTIMEIIQDTLLPEGVTLIAFNWLDTFYIYFLMSFTIGLIITLPYTAFHLYSFIAPALYAHEKSSMIKFVVVFVFLFSLGVFYAYYLLLPTTFTVLYRFVFQTRVLPFFSVKDFFGMVAFGMFGSGLFYTFPLVIYFLVRAGLLEISTLKDRRKQLFTFLLIVTAFLTPDPTPFSMLLMTVPFYLLYEVTIFLLGKSKVDYEIDIKKGMSASKEYLERLSEND
jgi:sec-independent protein translocase protein TatC